MAAASHIRDVHPVCLLSLLTFLGTPCTHTTTAAEENTSDEQRSKAGKEAAKEFF